MIEAGKNACRRSMRLARDSACDDKVLPAAVDEEEAAAAAAATGEAAAVAEEVAAPSGREDRPLVVAAAVEDVSLDMVTLKMSSRLDNIRYEESSCVRARLWRRGVNCNRSLL